MSKVKNKMSMSNQVLYSFIIGIAAGIFFGDLLEWMTVIGDGYIKLLQMTIIPYIIVSLISSLGRLTLEQAKSVGVKVGKLMLLIWGVGILVMFLIQFTFPQWQSGSFFSLKALARPEGVNLMDLYIPSNPFYSLANSYIPAIVVFCVATGLALISIKDKNMLLEPMDMLGTAFNKVTSYVVKFMPIGIFAMTAATAGTMDLAELQKIQVYFVAHIVMTILLTYWVLPAIVASFTPFSYKDITNIARDALITAFAAGNIFIILPSLIEHTKELFHKYNIADEHTDDYANIIVPVVFSFPNLGKLLTIVFVLFAAWFSGVKIDFMTYLGMSFNGLVSLFGSVYLTIPLLLNSLELSTDLFQLYMVSSLFTSRFISLLAAMNIFILAIGGTAMLAGLAKIKMKRLVFYATLTPVVMGTTLLLTSLMLNFTVNTENTMDDVITQMTAAQTLPEEVTSYKFNTLAAPVAPRSLKTIKHSGVLRVGYNPRQVPFSYFNVNGDLVGFDIDMVNKLASELKVEVVFVPYSDVEAEKAMSSGQFDIAISGLQMTTNRIQALNYTNTVLTLHYSLVVKDHRVEEFSFSDESSFQRTIKLAAVGDYSIVPQLKQKYPNLTVEQISSDQAFFEDDGKTWDGLLISLEAGKAWTMLYPEYSAVYNRDSIRAYPAAYAVAQGNISLQTFLNSWLIIQESSGNIDTLYNYWILGENAIPPTPRWSVIRDVLGWVD